MGEGRFVSRLRDMLIDGPAPEAKKPRLGRGFFFCTAPELARFMVQAAACVGIMPAVRTMRF
jgi:hypothetical protein